MKVIAGLEKEFVLDKSGWREIASDLWKKLLVYCLDFQARRVHFSKLGGYMIRAVVILQFVMLAAILSFGYWRTRRVGRFTYLGICLIFGLLTLDILTFAIYGEALKGEDWNHWRGYFPGGMIVLTVLTFDLLYAFVVAVIVIARKLTRGQKNCSQYNLTNQS